MTGKEVGSQQEDLLPTLGLSGLPSLSKNIYIKAINNLPKNSRVEKCLGRETTHLLIALPYTITHPCYR